MPHGAPPKVGLNKYLTCPMKTKAQVAGENKQITDLALDEFDMVFSLRRIGQWPDLEIGKRYKLSEADVRKVFSQYAELREVLKQQPQMPGAVQQELAEQQKRKKRCDAVYETTAEKQKAYRQRQKEKQQESQDARQKGNILAVTDPLTSDAS